MSKTTMPSSGSAAWLWMLLTSMAAGADTSAAGSLTGWVEDAQGGRVKSACVYVCRQDTGIPLAASSKRSFTEEFAANQKAALELLFATTDAEGRFRFDRLPAGEYRVLAQSWPGKETVKGLLEINGREIRLHGVVEHLKVVGGDTAQCIVKPLGQEKLEIEVKSGNNETLLLLSAAPPRADPVLGFVGWSGPMMQKFIGGNRMPLGKTTVSGLPAGTVHMAVIAADNMPGFGAGQVEIRPGVTARANIPFVAVWSDAQHDPPPRLAALFKEIEPLIRTGRLTPADLDKACGIERRERRTPFADQFLAENLDREIELPTGRKARVGDVAAVMGYVQIQQTRESWARAAARAAKAKEAPPAGTVDYETSLRALHAELGAAYPCFALKGIDWKAVGEELLPRAKGLKDPREFGLLVLEMVARLEDSHAQVAAGSLKLPDVPFPRWDPGLACLLDDRGQPVVYHLDRDGPAEKAGVKVGMAVVAVNGVPASKAMDACMKQLSRYEGYSSQRYLKYHAARFFLRQMERGKEVTLTMENLDGTKKEFKLLAALNVRYLPRLPVPVRGVSDSADVSWTRLDGNLGYIYVRRIGPELIALLDRAVGELKDAKGLIVDVRGNSGGGFDAARAHRNFAPDDPVEPNRPRFGKPIALLLDSRCISAGEGWASWFVAKNRARTFGETTAGASSRKTTYTMPGGYYRVTYPVKAYQGFLDRPIERRGLEPDVPVVQTAADLAAGRDTILEAARKHLLKDQE